MDATEVTQADYEALMGVNPSDFEGDGERPVEQVTWYDAVLYCNARSKRDGLEPVYQYASIKKGDDGECIGLVKLTIDFSKNGYRLPTEAEWEYACRAGTTTEYYWGDDMDGAYAWCENAGGKTQPVGTKKPNAWGLYDMIGNVWEWCHDWYAEDYYAGSRVKNPRGPNKKGVCRVIRGGSWKPNDSHPPCSAGRHCWFPDGCENDLGLRCVLVR
jgi:formylglycine-generating enzyme required for sulfatase activity